MSDFLVLLTGACIRHDPKNCYGETIKIGMDKVWSRLKPEMTFGINHVVYYANDDVFVGVETKDDAEIDGLEKRKIEVERSYKHLHIGPYSGLPEAHAKARSEVLKVQDSLVFPIIEVYGHWNKDPGKLETQLVFPLK